LNFKEFSEIIIPRKNDQIKKSITEKNNNYNKKNLNNEIFNYFAKILQIELDFINKSAIISEKLRFSREVTSYEMFLMIDMKNEKYLNESNVLNFLKRNSLNDFSNLEAHDIIFRLCKLDKLNISYEDFQDIFTPIKILNNENYSQEKNNKIDYNNETNKKVNKYEQINNGESIGILNFSYFINKIFVKLINLYFKSQNRISKIKQ